jgi:hypothetical protein
VNTSINSLVAAAGLTIKYEYDEDGFVSACRAVDSSGLVACHAKDAAGIREWLESCSDDDETTGCIDEGNHVRDRLSEGSVPQDWQFDGE